MNIEGQIIGIKYQVGHEAVLKLTSSKLKGKLPLLSNTKSITRFAQLNNFSKKHTDYITSIFEEARTNSFTIKIEYSKR